MLSVLKTNLKISLAGAVALLFLCPPGVPAAQKNAICSGVINARRLNVRSGPSQASVVVMVLEKGTRVDVLEEQGGIGGWLTVEYNGKTGYIRNRPRYILLKSVGASGETAAPVPAKKKKAAETVKQAEETQKAIEKKIAAEEERVDAFSEKELEILEGLNEIDYALNRARVRADTLARESRDLEITIENIQSEKFELAGQIGKNQTYAGERLAALYRMGMIGSLDMMAVPASVFDFFLKQNAMKRIIASDFQLLEDQTRDLSKLGTLESELAGQRAAKTKLETDLSLQIRIKKKESEKKELILHEIRRKKELSQAALASLKDSAKALDDKLYTIEKQVFHPIDDSFFSHQKGRLPIPVKGKVVSYFGPSTSGDYKAFTFKSGIDIKVERGEPVRSVFKGEVMFADWLKGYGNILIINHGENYYTLYAHVQEIFKKKGETVDTGEVIATAGDTGSIKGLCLHFEVRHHGKPVNPMNWIKKGV